jgi:hypothetical protein
MKHRALLLAALATALLTALALQRVGRLRLQARSTSPTRGAAGRAEEAPAPSHYRQVQPHHWRDCLLTR